MPQPEPSRRASGRRRRPPAALLLALALLLAAGPIALALSHPNRVSARMPTHTLDELAHEGGCRLTQHDADPKTTPRVRGRVDERVARNDGSSAGRRRPTNLASVHALL